jgi:hypothetical protein
LIQPEGQNLAHTATMLRMVEEVINTEHAKSQAFGLSRVSMAAGPAQVNSQIPSGPGPRSNLNRIVGMHQQNFHESTELRTRLVRKNLRKNLASRRPA